MWENGSSVWSIRVVDDPCGVLNQQTSKAFRMRLVWLWVGRVRVTAAKPALSPSRVLRAGQGRGRDAVGHVHCSVRRHYSLWSFEHARCAQAKGAPAQGEAGVGQAADRGAGAAKDAAGQAKGAAKDAAGQVGSCEGLGITVLDQEVCGGQVGCTLAVIVVEG